MEGGVGIVAGVSEGKAFDGAGGEVGGTCLFGGANVTTNPESQDLGMTLAKPTGFEIELGPSIGADYHAYSTYTLSGPIVPAGVEWRPCTRVSG